MLWSKAIALQVSLKHNLVFNVSEIAKALITVFGCCMQVDPTGSGRVAAADAALFLKRSGLADLVLGKVSEH